ncbi:MAG: helix-turn-helix transcriptional regulator [Desulfobacterales bacterium]|nr:helix-turn-helix transcriptional regulator [Desulfobacterales bacterium]MDD4073491.1 helix-turn-helix transcriptional regulator [Desulfobacterales bacterium]MDD4394148.1 helix-turn-helix transcriptional regulator [Desulfobacterales bacterium]
MSTPTEYQTIEHCGHPAFVLVPWEDWCRIKPFLEAEKARSSGIPQEVVEAHVLRNEPIIKAWREYLCITQKELAGRMGMSQAAVVKFERPNARLRTATVKKIALALGLNAEQLCPDGRAGESKE